MIQTRSESVFKAAVPAAPATLRVTEIYKSVQGESTWAGLPCTFVRLARCNLRCVWCDTAYSFYGGDKMSLVQIVKACDALGCELVEITGGEPLVQRECPELARRLLDKGYTVLVETSGSLPIDVLPEGVISIMDLKCPDSGECAKNHWPNIAALRPRDEVKFVIAGRADYEWARGVTREHDLPARCNAVLFSPVFSAVEPKTLVSWILEDELPVRFQLQMHKFIWPPSERGV
jgi:7-carboxy-7-deazaguanine synthase